MTLLDAYALVALLGDEPAAPQVRKVLSDGACAVVTPNLAEAGYFLAREHGIRPVETAAAVAELKAAGLAIVGLGEREAWRAAELRCDHYHRRDRPVSLADCTLLATAQAEDRVATADADLLAIAEAERIKALALPGRTQA